MKVSSLLVLASLFLVTCIGRAAAIAADLVDMQGEQQASVGKAEPAGRCIDGRFGAALLNSAERLKAREKTLLDREAALKALETHVEKRFSDLETARKEFGAAAEKLAGARSAELARVASVYSNMKPAQAASIVDGMDSKFAAGLLAQMSGESAASIVAAMDPKKAYVVTVLMANRSALDGVK